MAWIAAATAVAALAVTGQASAATTHFYYDALGRVIGATGDNQGEVKSYFFDGADNRTYFQMTRPGAPVNNQKMTYDEYLFRDQSLTSADGRFVLSLQGDGNLVLYGPSGALWSSNTYLSQAAWLLMRTDGDLVLYDPQWNILWRAGSGGHPGSVFVVQSDGNLVIYAQDGTALWNSGTYGH